MGSGGDEQLPSDRVTMNVRIYRGDLAIIKRMARTQTAERPVRSRAVTPADVIRELLAERAKERGSGT